MSKPSVDILIPIKDDEAYYQFAKICIASLQENLINPIRKIFLVGNLSELKKHFKKSKIITLVCEKKYLKKIFRSNKVKPSTSSHFENTWVLQQLIKLYSFRLGKGSSTLIVDADLCVLKPIQFIENNKYIFYMENEHYPPYFDTIYGLTGLRKQCPESFIADNIIFDKAVLKEMLKFIEKHTGKSFISSLAEALEEQGDVIPPGISEYELYGTYLSAFHPERIHKKIVNKLHGGPHVLITDPQISYKDVKENVEHNNYFIPMISSNRATAPGKQYQIEDLDFWKPN